MRERGEVILWFLDRNYGFAKRPAPHGDVYIHASDVISGGVPYRGAIVEFTVGEKRRAKNIRVIRGAAHAS